MSWTMYSLDGQRKYLTQSETRKFLEAAGKEDLATYAFCIVIAVTGCRISEALALTVDNIDFETKIIVFECLKKRRRSIFRSVPVPVEVLATLRTLIRKQRIASGERLWTWSRMTGYRRIREIMEVTGIVGPQGSPKGLRHGFGVSAIQAGVPLNMVQRWLGHADMKTTAIYTSAIGPEERDIASRMWGKSFQLGERRAGADRFPNARSGNKNVSCQYVELEKSDGAGDNGRRELKGKRARAGDQAYAYS